MVNQNQILNEYFNLLENKEILKLLNESENKHEVIGFGQKIKTIISKTKLSDKDKEKSKKEIVKNRETSKYKKLKKIIENYFKHKNRDRLKKELTSLYDYAKANLITIIISI